MSLLTLVNLIRGVGCCNGVLGGLSISFFGAMISGTPSMCDIRLKNQSYNLSKKRWRPHTKKTYPQLVCVFVDEGAFLVVGPRILPKVLNLGDEGFPAREFIAGNCLLNVFQSNRMRNLPVVVRVIPSRRLLVEFKCYLSLRIPGPGKLLQVANTHRFWQPTLDPEGQSFLARFCAAPAANSHFLWLESRPSVRFPSFGLWNR